MKPNRPGQITVFTVLWFCLSLLSGASIAAYFHPQNPLVSLALFGVGILLPFLLSAVMAKVFGKPRAD